MELTNKMRSMYKFSLSDDQIIKYEKWHKKQLKKDRTFPAAGERFEFCFLPTGLGTVVTVKDLILNQELDLTEDF